MVNPKYSLKTAVLVSRRAFDNLRFVPTDENDKTDNRPFSMISDVSILLNSERIINTLGEDVYRALINSFVPKKSPYQNNEGVTDKELFMVKPRHCQEHSEIRAWSRHIMDSMDNLIESEKQALLEKQAAEQTTTTTETKTE